MLSIKLFLLRLILKHIHCEISNFRVLMLKNLDTSRKEWERLLYCRCLATRASHFPPRVSCQLRIPPSRECPASSEAIRNPGSDPGLFLTPGFKDIEDYCSFKSLSEEQLIPVGPDLMSFCSVPSYY